jgi:hypothetical protein
MIKAELTLKLGTKLLKICSEGKETDVIKNLSFWSTLPDKCNACGSLNLGMFYRRAKEKFDYYGLTCNDCGADLTFHQKMDGGAFYIEKKDKFERFTPSNQIEHKPSKKDDVEF